jgi:hypothetical protein
MSKKTGMETTIAYQDAQGMTRLAQLCTRYPVAIGAG